VIYYRLWCCALFVNASLFFRKNYLWLENATCVQTVCIAVDGVWQQKAEATEFFYTTHAVCARSCFFRCIINIFRTYTRTQKFSFFSLRVTKKKKNNKLIRLAFFFNPVPGVLSSVLLQELLGVTWKGRGCGGCGNVNIARRNKAVIHFRY